MNDTLEPGTLCTAYWLEMGRKRDDNGFPFLNLSALSLSPFSLSSLSRCLFFLVQKPESRNSRGSFDREDGSLQGPVSFPMSCAFFMFTPTGTCPFSISISIPAAFVFPELSKTLFFSSFSDSLLPSSHFSLRLFATSSSMFSIFTTKETGI